jgi:3-oxoacyl-[acyl-carrier protein] reductase
MDLGLMGASAVVVGGSRGLGRATAVALGKEGARVAVLARSPKGLAKTVDLVRETGVDAFGVIADVGSNEDVLRAFAEIDERWGELNILVNNAANSFGTQGLFEDISDDMWRQAFDQITLGYARTMRAAVPLMRKAGWGRIANLSTASTQLFMPKIGVYNVTKSAVAALSKHMGLALAPENITVNTVSPGGIMVAGGDWGPMLNAAFAERGLDSTNPHHACEIMKQLFDNEPPQMGRHGMIEEYVAVLLFVVSKANSYMTGANLNVDGGTNF